MPIPLAKKCVMDDIYYKSGGFNYSEVMEELSRIDDEIAEEREKDDSEYNKEKEFKLLYKQFLTGLKLNTGIRLF